MNESPMSNEEIDRLRTQLELAEKGRREAISRLSMPANASWKDILAERMAAHHEALGLEQKSTKTR